MKTNALRSAEELTDDDIIEVEVIEPAPGSGFYPASPPPVPAHVLPRIASIPDGVETNVSDLVPVLARLSDPLSMPKVNAEVGALLPNEALIVSLIESNMTIQAIVGVSPLGEEETMRILSKLVGTGAITLTE